VDAGGIAGIAVTSASSDRPDHRRQHSWWHPQWQLL